MNRTLNLGLLFSAIATPVATDGSLNVEAANALAERHVELGVEGIYCGGSSGEGLLLRLDERMQLLAAVAEGVNRRVPVVAHVGALSTRDAISLAKHAENMGVVALSMIAPIYYKYSPREIFSHYVAVLDAVNLPMIVYNIPQFTGHELAPDDDLLKDKRIVGVKYTALSMYQLERISNHHPNLQIVNGFDEAFLPSLAAGASGSIGTTISMQIDTFKAVRSHFADGNIKAAQYFQHRINDVIEKLVQLGVFPAAKWIEQELTGITLGPCRPPFQALPPSAGNKLKELTKMILNQNAEARSSLKAQTSL